LLDALLELFDLALDMVQGNQVLLHAALRLMREGVACFVEFWPPFGSEDIAVGV